MFHHRKNSQKPGGDLLSQFKHSFDSVIVRRNSDGTHPTQSHSQDDIHLMPGGDSKFSPTLNLEGLPELDFSQSLNTGFTPLDLLASQHPGCYTPRSSGMGAILHNQAGNLHSPSLDNLITTPPSRTDAVANNRTSLDPPSAQCIAPQIVQANPDIQQSTYAPSAFTYQDLDHGLMNESGFDSATFDMYSFDSAANPEANPVANTDTAQQVSPPSTIADHPYTEGTRFRYHAALRTSTAMVKSADEIPISYLNKGQVYGLMIMDLTPPVINSEPLQYRTFVRICFDDEGQRSNPALYWRLWKEGRGMDEAHQWGSDLVAIEFATTDGDHRHMQIEQVSIDGFCVTWIVEPADSTQFCTIPIRFHFLSTDFTHSKGVKGVPLRLCAKTELISPKIAGTPNEPEMCYCKVKLFRDHGAERKEANDVQHVQKSIGKLEQQIEYVGLGGGSGKRRRANNTSTDMTDSGPRGNSTKNSLEEKLAISQGMLTSSRTVNVLSLPGAAEDDPDIYPVQISTDQNSTEFVKDRTVNRHDLELPDQPPPERLPKSAACFFIRPSNEPGDVFRSIYLTERTAENLIEKICGKYHIDKSNIVRVLRIINDDFKVVVDDDTVRELPEGQVIIFDNCEITNAGNGGNCLKEIRIRLE